MNLRFAYRSLLALAAPLLVAACSSDGEVLSSAFPDDEQDFEGIIINIPNHASTTRAEVTPTADEGHISTLTVIAYPQVEVNNVLPPVQVKEVSGDIANSTLSENYKEVKMRLPENTYHIYVVANVSPSDFGPITNPTNGQVITSKEDTKKKAWADFSEEELQKLNIMTGVYAATDDLPMSCNYLAIRKKPSVIAANGSTTSWGEVFTGGNVPVAKKKTTAVFADLTFAVAKVNFSIVNGKAAYLKMDNTEADRVNFINCADHANLMKHAENLDTDNHLDDFKAGTYGAYYKWDSSCNYYQDYDPEATGNNAVKLPDDDHAFSANMLKDANKLTGTIPDTWCFRGTVYVPERLFAENASDQTKIKFQFNEESYNKKAEMGFGGKVTIPSSQTGQTDHEHIGVIRGVVYDVKAYTTEKNISFRVRVRPWSYETHTFDL